MSVPAKRVPFFKPSKELRELIGATSAKSSAKLDSNTGDVAEDT